MCVLLVCVVEVAGRCVSSISLGLPGICASNKSPPVYECVCVLLEGIVELVRRCVSSIVSLGLPGIWASNKSPPVLEGTVGGVRVCV